MKNIAWYLLLMSLLGSGCQGFIDGLVLDIEVPEQDPVLVPYCFINTKDSSIQVFVQQSQGILDSTEGRYVEDATVELYKNGVLWKTIDDEIRNSEGSVVGYAAMLDRPFYEEGYNNIYELRVSAANFETVTATQTVPMPKSAVNVEYFENAASSFGEIIDNVRVTIDDTPNEENYYQIILDLFSVGVVPSGDTVRQSRSIGGQALANTGSISNALDGVVLNDKLFDGQRFAADIGASFSGSSSSSTNEEITYSATVKLYLLAINRDEYLYQKSLYSYSNAIGNPFAEPSLLHSNTSSGLGMFSIIAETVEEFTF